MFLIAKNATLNNNLIFSNGRLLQNIILLINKCSQMDAIDKFTNELVERKTMQFDLLKQCKPEYEGSRNLKTSTKNFIKDINSLREPTLENNLNIENLNQTQIDYFLINAIDSNNLTDVTEIVEQCVLYGKLASFSIVKEILSFLSNNGCKTMVENIIRLYKVDHKAKCEYNTDFQHYVAKCYWVTGNSTLALDILREAYILSNNNLRKEIRQMLRSIVSETVGHKSEAVLVYLMELGKMLSTEFEDHYILACIWRKCFCSSWFSDQQHALNIIENYDDLRYLVANRSSSICYKMLRAHDINSVHRLIEIFLKFEFKSECQTCLRLLFEYQCWNKNIRACTEIVKTCLDLNMELTETQNQKFLNLLLGNHERHYSKKNIKSNKFELKF